MPDQAEEIQPEAATKLALLLVDDDPIIVDALSMVLEDDYLVYTAESRRKAKELLHKLKEIPPIALVDLGLPPFPHKPDEGFELIAELAAIRRDIKILVLSGQGERENIQHALALGAVDFIPKPCDIPLLKTRIAHQVMMLEAERTGAEGKPGGDDLLGESHEIKTLKALITQFAETPFSVLIEGESGCGKELVAKHIHDQSSRAAAPFMTINCAAFSPELLEAQLFGHAKGAYTGAVASKAGFFEEAGDGSLFLDEIGDLPLALQSKLLRVLENGEYYRLGETQARTSKARIVAATNRDLKKEVYSGGFRQDLYHRLSVLTIHVPPLRERDQDCLILLSHFRKLYAMGNAPFSLNAEAEDYLMKYPFPGNVRELRNIVIRLSHKYPGKMVDVEQLRSELDSPVMSGQEEGRFDEQEAIQDELLGQGFKLDDMLNEWERRYIIAALKMSGGNLSQAARLLGVNRTTLYSRTQRLSIETQE